jgi:hypothetical protein
MPMDWSSIVRQTMPCVVNIATDTIINKNGVEQRSREVGSGFLIDPSGIIATNKHVIAKAFHIIVTMSDRSQWNAQLIATAPILDFALVKIDVGHPLPFLKFADSEKAEVGEGYSVRRSVWPGHLGQLGYRQRGASRPDEHADRRLHSNRCGTQPRQFRRAHRLSHRQAMGGTEAEESDVHHTVTGLPWDAQSAMTIRATVSECGANRSAGIQGLDNVTVHAIPRATSGKT